MLWLLVAAATIPVDVSLRQFQAGKTLKAYAAREPRVSHGKGQYLVELDIGGTQPMSCTLFMRPVLAAYALAEVLADYKAKLKIEETSLRDIALVAGLPRALIDMRHSAGVSKFAFVGGERAFLCRHNEASLRELFERNIALLAEGTKQREGRHRVYAIRMGKKTPLGFSDVAHTSNGTINSDTVVWDSLLSGALLGTDTFFSGKFDGNDELIAGAFRSIVDGQLQSDLHVERTAPSAYAVSGRNFVAPVKATARGPLWVPLCKRFPVDGGPSDTFWEFLPSNQQSFLRAVRFHKGGVFISGEEQQREITLTPDGYVRLMRVLPNGMPDTVIEWELLSGG